MFTIFLLRTKKIISSLGLNQRGVSLVELMVTVAISTIIVIGMSNALSSFYKEVNIANFKGVMEGIHQQMYQNIMGSNSFNATLNHPNNDDDGDVAAANGLSDGDGGAAADALGDDMMDCVRSGTLCTIQAANVDAFILYDPGGNLIFDGETGYSAVNGVGTKGWDYQGRPCTTFDFVNGNDACPFSYGLTWERVCANAAAGTTCNSPGIHIIARPFFRPESSSGRAFSYNINKYRIDITRGTSSVDEPFTVAETVTVQNELNPGCNTVFNWSTIRQFDTEVTDPLDNVTVAQPNITFLKSGTFVCSLIVPGYGVNGFRVRIQDVTNGLTLAQTSVTAYAPTGVQALARLDATFNVPNANTNVQVQMNCETASSTFIDMGMPIPDGGGSYAGGTTMSTMTCRRVN